MEADNAVEGGAANDPCQAAVGPTPARLLHAPQSNVSKR